MFFSLRVHGSSGLPAKGFVDHFELVDFLRAGNDAFEFPCGLGIAEVFPLD